MNNHQQNEPLNIIEHIYKKLPYLNPALRRIAEFILENPEECKTMTIRQLATACDVAESTVTRFVKEIDLNSYQDLKLAIAEALFANNDGEALDEEKHVYEGITAPTQCRRSLKKWSTAIFKHWPTPSSGSTLPSWTRLCS